MHAIGVVSLNAAATVCLPAATADVGIINQTKQFQNLIVLLIYFVIIFMILYHVLITPSVLRVIEK